MVYNMVYTSVCAVKLCDTIVLLKTYVFNVHEIDNWIVSSELNLTGISSDVSKGCAFFHEKLQYCEHYFRVSSAGRSQNICF